MTKRQAKKAAYKAIFKENKSHNEVFKELRSEGGLGSEELATILEAIPSKAKHHETRIFWLIYSGLLGLIILLRLIYLALMVSSGYLDPNPLIIITILLFGLFVPIIGIFGAFTGRKETLLPVGGLLVFGVLRSLRTGNVAMGPEQIGGFVLIAVILVMIVILHLKWKTPYKKEVTTVEVDGVKKKKTEITFQDDATVDSDVIDNL